MEQIYASTCSCMNKQILEDGILKWSLSTSKKEFAMILFLTPCLKKSFKLKKKKNISD